MIDVLIAEDEAPAREELAHLLRGDDRVGEILLASSGAQALALLSERAVGIAFLDIHMPGLNGIELARAVDALAAPPAIVFVTADEARAVEAFEVRAADYLLKPVRIERLRRAVDRALELGEATPAGETLPVTVGQSVRFVRQRDVRWVQAQGDYSRLHTGEGAGHLVRVPISELDARWADAGFVRVHRSYLVHAASVTQARLSGSEPTLTVAGIDLPVSRRLLPAVREALLGGPR